MCTLCFNIVWRPIHQPNTRQLSLKSLKNSVVAFTFNIVWKPIYKRNMRQLTLKSLKKLVDALWIWRLWILYEFVCWSRVILFSVILFTAKYFPLGIGSKVFLFRYIRHYPALWWSQNSYFINASRCTTRYQADSLVDSVLSSASLSSGESSIPGVCNSCLVHPLARCLCGS